MAEHVTSSRGSGRSPETKRALRLGVKLLVVCAALVGALVMRERHFIYFPYRELVAAPADYGLEADELWLTAEDGTKLHGWWIHGKPGFGAELQKPNVLVWYHGNAGNISHRLDNARLLVDRFGLDILLVDYRGYGRSEGVPFEAGLYQDGFAIYAEAARRVPADRIVLFGRSLGAAVAVEVAVRKQVGAIILETPFRSIPAMAREIYPFVPPFFIRTRFDAESKIAQVAAPVLILHGDRDDIVPVAHGRRLFELAPEPKRFYVIPGARHNDTYVVGGEKYLQAWEDFLKPLL